MQSKVYIKISEVLSLVLHCRNTQDTAQKMDFSIKDFFSKCAQIRRKLGIWSHLLKESLMENFIFYSMGIFTEIAVSVHLFYTRFLEIPRKAVAAREVPGVSGIHFSTMPRSRKMGSSLEVDEIFEFSYCYQNLEYSG